MLRQFPIITFLFIILFGADLTLHGQLKVDDNHNLHQSADFKLLLDWFTGEINNYEQHAEDEYAKEKEGKDIDTHHHIHSIFAPIKLHELGEYIFHVQQSNGIDLNQVFRQRVYAFNENYKENVIEMNIYKYLDAKKYYDLHKKT